MNTLPAGGGPIASADGTAPAFAALVAADERRQARIARMVRHDIIQALTTLRMDALWMRQHLYDRQGVAATLDDSMRLLQDVIARTWRLASELGAVVVEDLGLPAALEFLADGFTQDTGQSCALELADDPRLEPFLATGLFRVVQEWLEQLPPHPRGVRVRLATEGGRAVLTLEAEVPGESAHRHPGASQALEARVQAMGGAFTRSQPAAGVLRVEMHVGARPGGACPLPA